MESLVTSLLLTAAGVLSFLIISCNALAIFILLTTPRLRQDTNSTCIRVSLSLADLLSGLCLPAVFYGELVLAKTSPFCKAVVRTTTFCCMVSILHQTLLALDRYLALSRPLRYVSLATTPRLMAAILGAWFLCLAVVSLNFIPNKRNDSSNASCHDVFNLPFFATFVVVMLALPISILVATYVAIFRIARAHHRRLVPHHAHHTTEQGGTSPDCSNYGVSRNSENVESASSSGGCVEQIPQSVAGVRSAGSDIQTQELQVRMSCDKNGELVSGATLVKCDSASLMTKTNFASEADGKNVVFPHLAEGINNGVGCGHEVPKTKPISMNPPENKFPTANGSSILTMEDDCCRFFISDNLKNKEDTPHCDKDELYEQQVPNHASNSKENSRRQNESQEERHVTFQNQSEPTQSSLPVEESIPSLMTSSDVRKQLKKVTRDARRAEKEKKAKSSSSAFRNTLRSTRLLAAMCVYFFVSWTPFLVYGVFEFAVLHAPQPPLYFTLLALLGVGSALGNTVLYFFSYKSIRLILKHRFFPHTAQGAG